MVLLLLCALAFLGAHVYGAWNGLRREYGLWQFFGRFLAMQYLEKAFDILCIEWFLTKSHFFRRYYPETVGCAVYNQFGFNRKEQLTRIWYCRIPGAGGAVYVEIKAWERRLT